MDLGKLISRQLRAKDLTRSRDSLQLRHIALLRDQHRQRAQRQK